MPSPLAHGATAALVTYWCARGEGEPQARFGLRWPQLLAVAILLSLLPDLPTALGLLNGDLAAFHNLQEHSLAAAVVASILVGFIASRATRSHGPAWFGLSLLCYGLHVGMDYLTVGRGVMALWPFTDARLGAPVRLFYGLHWSEGWLSWRHVWTIVTEALAVGVIAWALLRLRAKRRPYVLESPSGHGVERSSES